MCVLSAYRSLSEAIEGHPTRAVCTPVPLPASLDTKRSDLAGPNRYRRNFYVLSSLILSVNLTVNHMVRSPARLPDQYCHSTAENIPHSVDATVSSLLHIRRISGIPKSPRRSFSRSCVGKCFGRTPAAGFRGFQRRRLTKLVERTRTGRIRVRTVGCRLRRACPAELSRSVFSDVCSLETQALGWKRRRRSFGRSSPRMRVASR